MTQEPASRAGSVGFDFSDTEGSSLAAIKRGTGVLLALSFDDGEGFSQQVSIDLDATKTYELAQWLIAQCDLTAPRSEAACRLLLDVTGVRVERVQEISREDEIAEGVADGQFYDSLWDSINEKQPWSSNPWVWVIEFRRAPTSTTGVQK